VSRATFASHQLLVASPEIQMELLKAVVATGVTVVVVLINGGGIGDADLKDLPDAILEAFYPGEIGGDAIAAVLTGDVPPAGRLPMTIYDASFTDVRPHIGDMDLRGGEGITYRYYTGQPLWEFGFGLSYSSFDLKLAGESAVEVTSDDMAASFDKYYDAKGRGSYSPVAFTVQVTNTGDVTCDFVVLGFLSSDHPDAPQKELFNYDRVRALAPNATATVILQVPAQVLSIVDADGNEDILPGEYSITIGGPSDPNPAEGSLVVTGDAVRIFSFPEDTI
jgi:xylan 1,4-beta-xylosidase